MITGFPFFLNFSPKNGDCAFKCANVVGHFWKKWGCTFAPISFNYRDFKDLEKKEELVLWNV
jgi:hypothetical protein